MNIRVPAFLLLILISFSAVAQTSVQLSSSEIKLAIKKLNTVGRALYIAAHPDDENTRLLAYLAKEKKFRTGYLSLTRGDGGQNLIGNEQSELLGLIRTQELLAARRTDGAEQFFTRAIDFGFSKNPEETFKIWDKEQILADAVWVIRKFRPDIIITRFPEDSRAGHGQHSASAIIAREAFFAAADPERFPEQLDELQAWQAKRIVWNTSSFGGNSTNPAEQIRLDIGAYNPLLGKSYGEIAAESRTNHKSQGFGAASQRGEAVEYFTHTAGIPAKADIFEDIRTDWDAIPGGKEIGRMIQAVDQNFNMDKPWMSTAELVKVFTSISKLPEAYWREHKLLEVKDLIAATAGLWFESYSDRAIVTVGDSIAIRSQVIVQSPAEIRLRSLNGRPADRSLKPGNLISITSKTPAPAITDPYWLHDDHPIGMYTVSGRDLVGQPENPAPATVVYTFVIHDTEISYESPVVFKYTNQVRGEIYQPLVVAPPVTATVPDKAYVFAGNTAKTINILLKAFKEGVTGIIKPALPDGWQAEPAQVPFEFSRAGEERTVQFIVRPGGNSSSGVLSFNMNIDGTVYNRGSRTIAYEHIPSQTLFPLASARVERVDLKTGGKKIGYIAGAGDLVPEALAQIGYQITSLSENQILGTDLSQYDAIIAGVRLYNVNERMNVIQPKLMDYVEKGGTLLVQYNVSSPLRIQELGPYPFRISRDRVTDENAAVRFIARDHPVLNYPNKITEKDFEGWIQERGLYFTSDADNRYTRILSMNDPGETPKDGSLLVADYGKGRFVYTSLVFFRELPAGIPGAYRLFVNLITKN